MSLIRTCFRRGTIGVACAAIGLALAVPLQGTAQAQDISLRGFIVNTETGQPLPGANVLVQRLGTSQQPKGAAADRNGYYHVDELSPGRFALQVSFVGYRSLRDTIRLTGSEEQVSRTFELEPADQTLEEVIVTGDEGGATTQQGGRQWITPEDLEHVPTPSISGDLASYLQSLPGVVSLGDRGGQLFIRGGAPDQNLVLMDNMQIFRPFHIVGFYSAFPQELISDAEVFAGGFPARYSGRISSVIDVEMRGGNREHVEAGVTAGPFLTGLRAEGPLNDDGLSLLASARFSQIERTAPVMLGQEQPLKFNDQFVKLQNTFDTGRCGATGMHTYDRGKIDREAGDIFQWSNYAFGGRCVAFGPGSAGVADLSLSSSYARNAVGQGGDPEREASRWSLDTKVDVSRPLEGDTELRGGVKMHLYRLTYSLGEKFQGFRRQNEGWIRFDGHVGATFSIAEHLELRPGVALAVPLGYGASLEPRLRASWRPAGADDKELSAAFGRYRQTVVGLSDERDLGSVFTAWVPAPLEQRRPYAWHAILGWRQQFGAFGLTAEGYYKDVGNLAVPAVNMLARFTTELRAADGTTWGFDLRGEFERGPVYGYLGYGFSWTRYTAAREDLGSWFGTGIQGYHPPHDRRHELNAVLSADLGVATADLRWQFGSGMPYTKPFGFDLYIQLRELLESPRSYGTPRLLYGKPYRNRLPAYHRLDVSLERTVEMNYADLTVKAGAINFYNRENLFYFDLFTQRRVDQLPLVPYVALEITTN